MCKKLTIFSVVVFVLGLAVGAGAQGPDPSMLGWWKLDEGVGDTAVDSSGRVNHGTIFNLSGGMGVGGSAWVDDPERGIVLSFGGDDTNGTYVVTPEMIPAMDLENEFTWAFWCKQEGDGTGVNQTILGNRYGGTASPLQFVKFTPTKFEYYNDDADYLDSITYTVPLPDGEWMHHAVVLDGADLTYYRNGVVTHTNTIAKTMDENPFYIGGDPLGERWSGWLSDVRIYERALSAEEIRAMVPPRLKAYKPLPTDGALGVTSPLFQWTQGETALFHDIYFGTSPELTEADKVAARQPFALYYHIQGLTPGTTYYWRVDEIEADMVTMYTGDLWTFTALPLTAWAPSPADGREKAAQAPVLSWTPGQGAAGHHVYFGQTAEAVQEGAPETDKGDVAETTFSAGLLRAGTTYYWRVDETDMAGEVLTGEVWSFTTGQPAEGKIVREWWMGNSGVVVAGLTDDPRYPGSPDGSELLDLFEGPTDWSDNYGSRLYGWLVPPESGDYTFWIASDDGSELWLSTDEDPANGVLIASVPTWVPARDFDNTGGGLGDADAQKSDAIALVAGTKYYIEALMNEGTGGDNIAVAWQAPGGTREVIEGEFVSTFALPPLNAAGPSPENGASDTIQSPILSWFAGENAIRHDVYFGDDADAVANADTSSPEHKGQQAGTTYNPGALEWGKSYYWRVDETEADDTVLKGGVWSFSTAAYLLVEDFESYDDDMDAGTAIFQTWIDGWENGTGATVGYLESSNGTFGETTIVHGGKQSMPLDYNNVNSPYYSETERAFTPSLNLTAGGMDTLTLYVRGQATNDPAVLYVALEDSAGNVAVVGYSDDTAATSLKWLEWNIPLGDFTGVNAAAIRTIYIGAGDRDAPTAGGAGLVYVDDVRATKPTSTE